MMIKIKKMTEQFHMSGQKNECSHRSFSYQYLFQLICRGLQQLFTIASPPLAVADICTEPNDMQPQCNAV